VWHNYDERAISTLWCLLYIYNKISIIFSDEKKKLSLQENNNKLTCIICNKLVVSFAMNQLINL